MKSFRVLGVLLLVCLLLAHAEPRKTRGGSSRGGSKTSRGSSRRQPQTQQSSGNSGQGLSHSGLASLSYSGYNSQPAKKPQPSAPAPQPKKPEQPVGWNVNKDTAVKKEVGTSQNIPSNNQPAYPSSGGLSGSSGSQGGAGHAYPASNGLSGTGTAGQHSYPASSGGSGTAGGTGQHSYPASNGASGGVNQQPAYPPSSGLSGGAVNQQPSYPASNGLSGSGPSQVRPQTNVGQQPPPYSANAPVGSANAYPVNNNPYGAPAGGYHNQGPPPAYSPQGYGGHGGPPPPYGGSPQGYGGYGGAPGYGGYGGHGGYGGYGGMGGAGGFGGFGGGNNFGGYYGKPKSSFLSGNKFGLILAGLAVWNLARSGSRTNHYHYHNDNKDGSKVDPAQPDVPDPILQDLINCTLTMTSVNDTDVVLIPCVIATSFSPDAKLNGKSSAPEFVPDSSSPLNCTIGVLTKNGTEFKTNIPCESLSNLAPKDTPLDGPRNGTMSDEPEPPLEVIPLSTPSTTTVISSDVTPSTIPAETNSTTVAPVSSSELPSSTSTTPIPLETSPSTAAVHSDELTTPKPE